MSSDSVGEAGIHQTAWANSRGRRDAAQRWLLDLEKAASFTSTLQPSAKHSTASVTLVSDN